jgi:HAE1 family hydrophobic/amphiphilic exporter-1
VNLSRLSIKRPVAVLMAVCVAMLLGVVSLSNLAVDLFPQLNIPVAVVVTTYPGAGPQEVEKLITQPLEGAISTVSSIEAVSSQTAEGVSMVIAQFDWGTDMDFATLEMREKVDGVRARLPDGASTPTVFKADPAAMPVLQIGLAGDFHLDQLQAIAEDTIAPRLERLAGVASVTISGGSEREIAVDVDPRKAQVYGVTLQQVSAMLQAENLNLPAGRVTDDQTKYLVRTTAEFKSVDEIRDLPLRTVRGVIHLRDIAQVEERLPDTEHRTWVNGEPTVTIAVQKQTDANTVNVVGAVLKAMGQMQSELPQGLNYFPVNNQAEFINQSIRDVVRNAIVGGLLAMGILLLFLRNFRSTIVIGVAIPISIISTFVLMYFFDLTLNLLSLGGLALGIGMLVDNSVVVLENIYRHREQGAELDLAAGDGSTEVTAAITASTLTTMSVFLPLIFVGGFAAHIFRDLSLTVSFSLFCSLFVALTLVPVMTSRWLKSSRSQGSRWRWAQAIGTRFERLFRAVDQRYRSLLDTALRRRKMVAASVLALIVATFLVMPMVGMEFMPSMDSGEFSISINLPHGSSLEATEEVLQKVVKHVEEIPELETMWVYLGSSGGMFGSSSSETAGVSAKLVSKDDRRRSTEQIVTELDQHLALIPGADIQAVASTGWGGMDFSGGAPIRINLKGDDFDILRDVSDEIVRRVAAVPGTRLVESSFEKGQPEVQVRVDRQRAAAYGLGAYEIASTLRSAIEGTVATRYRVEGEELDVRVRLEESSTDDLMDLQSIIFHAPTGQAVMLGQVADLVMAEGPYSIAREDQSRVVTVSSYLAGRPLGSVMNDIQATLNQMPLPPGYSIDYGGESQDMLEVFGDLFVALLMAIALVYMVMAAQFESLLHPLVIMCAVPLAMIGAFWGLLLTGRTLNVIAYVGLIMLVGIVVNNAIVLVDFINQLRQRGQERLAAIKEAGPIRLRPILITTLTTVLGMLPLALGIGEGAEAQAPMATVVICGLLFSTLLTLVVVPVFYTLFEDYASPRTWYRGWRGFFRALFSKLTGLGKWRQNRSA